MQEVTDIEPSEKSTEPHETVDTVSTVSVQPSSLGSSEHFPRAKFTQERKPKIYPCPKCGKFYAQFKSRKSHVKKCNGSKTTKYFICEQCKKSLSSKNSLARHMNIFHSILPKEFSCSLCDSIFPTNRLLKAHDLVKHRTDKTIFYRCTVDGCEFKHNREAILKTHITKTHTDVQKFKCTICSFQCKSESGLMKHFKLVHGTVSSNENIFDGGDDENEDLLRQLNALEQALSS